MFFFDPFYLLFMAPAMILMFWAQSRVKGTYAKYSQVTTSSGLPGYMVAQRLLRSVGLESVHNAPGQRPDPERRAALAQSGVVSIERVGGQLSDHYDPSKKTLRLSEGVYDSNSVAAMAIVAHETGHAIQDQVRYPALVLRSTLVPAVRFGSTFGYLVIIGGFVMMMLGAAIGESIAWLGVMLFSLTLVFSLVTLPVEFDASKRALVLLQNNGITNQQELDASRRVLNAAALTYVAAMAASLMQILYWVFILLGRRD